MHNKKTFLMAVIAMLITTTVYSQTVPVSISAGYGFPAVDTKYLPEFYGVGKGNVSQQGVVTGSVDYQFSRRMSIGVMVTHASFSAPYYGYFSASDLPDLTARFENWAFMITMVRYIPVSRRASLYIRTAIGGNSWKQDYEDVHGNKVAVTSVDLPALAHQLALGMKCRLGLRTGIFVEGGYGKYIVRGGLSVRL
jgi:hypothetical protein